MKDTDYAEIVRKVVELRNAIDSALNDVYAGADDMSEFQSGVIAEAETIKDKLTEILEGLEVNE